MAHALMQLITQEAVCMQRVCCCHVYIAISVCCTLWPFVMIEASPRVMSSLFPFSFNLMQAARMQESSRMCCHDSHTCLLSLLRKELLSDWKITFPYPCGIWILHEMVLSHANPLRPLQVRAFSVSPCLENAGALMYRPKVSQTFHPASSLWNPYPNSSFLTMVHLAAPHSTTSLHAMMRTISSQPTLYPFDSLLACESLCKHQTHLT
jgi:hypothetical protein